MAFPPEFDSSTNTVYANRLNLDKRDVYFEGDGNNPMFFNVEGLPKFLSYGKHYFHISKLDDSIQQYRLQNNTEILFEAKSSNDVVLISGTSNINQKNGVATCFLEVQIDPARTYDEIYDGIGKLTLVATLQNKSNTKNLIPPSYQDKINYRCNFPINIRKNLLNANSPNIISPEHKLHTANGQFSFIKAAFTSLQGYSGGMTYGTDGSPDANPPHSGDSPD